MDRRKFLGLLALSAGAVACARTRIDQTPLPEGFEAIRDHLPAGAASDLNVFLGGQEFLAEREQRASFGLVDAAGNDVLGGAPRVWISDGTTVEGPFAAVSRRYEEVVLPGDPRGFYVTTMSIPRPGIATVLVEHDGSYGTAALQPRRRPLVPGVGEHAVAIPTPTVRNDRGIAALCTREPPCPMHQQRLDRVLGDGVPVVFTIASPKLCTSRTCGPVVNEILHVRRSHRDGAHFLHAEVYATGTPTVLAPTSEAWRIESEPWTFVIDGDGVIRTRFEGPVVADEIEPALAALI